MSKEFRKDSWFRNRLIRDASYHATYDRMKVDDSIHIMGEQDVRYIIEKVKESEKVV